MDSVTWRSKRIDDNPAALGFSRNEILRRKLEREVGVSSEVMLTADDRGRSAAAFADLADPSVMEDAWL